MGSCQDSFLGTHYNTADIDRRAISKIPQMIKAAIFLLFTDDGLFDGIFAVCEAPSDGAVLDKLKNAVAAHFSTEEAMFEKLSDGYDVAGHKKKHADFLATAGGLTAPVALDNCVFMKQWLVDHICNTDFGYKGKL